jgi:hypothetical protein
VAIILNAEAEPTEFWADTDLSPFGRKVCAADHVLVITRVRVRTSWTFVSVALGSTALCIPTAAYEHPLVGPGAGPLRFISGREARTPMCELGWKSLGVLELTALPSIDEAHWVPLVKETDVLLVGGGDALYLSHAIKVSDGTVEVVSEGHWRLFAPQYQEA